MPTAISHVLWYLWHPQEVADAATSIQGNLYLAAFAGWTDPDQDSALAAWPRPRGPAGPSANATALPDESLVARPARLLSPASKLCLAELRRRHDPEELFLSYLLADHRRRTGKRTGHAADAESPQ